MTNAALLDDIHDDDNEFDDEGSPMSTTPLSNSEYTMFIIIIEEEV